MTQAQQAAVIAAQQKFFDTEAAANAAQGDAVAASAAVDAAKHNRDVVVPAQVAQMTQASIDLYLAAIQADNTVIAATQAKWQAVAQAQADLQNAITTSLQTNAVEMMPPPVKQF